MLFLIDYDRKKGEIVSLRTFSESEQAQANDARLELELSLFHSGVEREVVILEAASEEQIRKTHARYFSSLEELIARFEAALRAA